MASANPVPYADCTWPYAVTQIFTRLDQIIGIAGGPYEHLDANDRIVMQTIVLRSNKKRAWCCEITVETIARQCGLSDRTVRRCLDDLHEAKLVIKERRKAGNRWLFRLGDAVLEGPADMPDGWRPYLAQKTETWYKARRRRQSSTQESSAVTQTARAVTPTDQCGSTVKRQEKLTPFRH